MIIVAMIPFCIALFFYVKYVIDTGFNASQKYKVLFILGMFLLVNEIVLKSYDIYTHQYYKMWFGDMCQAIAMFSIISVIFRWTTIIRIISTWGIIGSVATFGSGHFRFDTFDYKWFLETNILHMVLFAFGILTIVFHYKEFKYSDLYYSPIFIITYMLVYVLPMGVVLSHYFGNIFKFYSTALFKWSINTPGTDYHFFKEIPWPYPVPTIVFYCLGLSVNVSLGIGILEYKKYKMNTNRLKNKQSIKYMG